mgnify:CR=1 FL=1
MMRNYLPNLFDDYDVFDNFDRDFFGRKNPLFGHHEKDMLKTDIRDMKDHYEMLVDLPGFKKEDVKIQLNDGYLTIEAEKGLNKDEKDKEGSLIRQERYVGSVSRSFYVGEGVEEKDIQAKLNGGVLEINVPKVEEKEELPKRSYIEIE